MAIALDINERTDFILKADLALPPEKQTVFQIGPLDSGTLSYLKDSLRTWQMNNQAKEADADVRVNRSMNDRDSVRYGVKGWARLVNRKGDQIKFDPESHLKEFSVPKCGLRQGLTDQALDLLTPYLAELSAEVLAKSALTEQEVKN